jgi:trk system potassium uptake protein TrkA
VHSLRRGAAEALELVVHGDATNSNVVGRRIAELNLPEGVTVGALVRGPAPVQGGVDQRRVLIAHHDIVIEAEDHVILFLTSKDLVRRVERYFQVGLGFF